MKYKKPIPYKYILRSWQFKTKIIHLASFLFGIESSKWDIAQSPFLIWIQGWLTLILESWRHRLKDIFVMCPLLKQILETKELGVFKQNMNRKI